MNHSVKKIGIISDTHFENLSAGVAFFDQLFSSVFADIDLLLHAGDVVHPDLIDCVTAKPVLAVRGNCDADDHPDRRIVEVGNFRIGLRHGWGGLADLEQRVVGSFAGEMVDAVIYGHSHLPLVRRENGLLIMNPGSPTDRRQAPFHSVGILTVGQRLSGQIINLDAKRRRRN